MRLKAKLKSLFLSRGGHHDHFFSTASTATTVSCTTTTTTAPTTATATAATTVTTTITTTTTTIAPTATATTTMPRNHPSASKSMMDLSGRSTEDQHETLHKASSVWDVRSKVRRRPPSEFSRLHTLSEAPPEPRVRPISLPGTSVEERPLRPKRTSAIQWAEGVGRQEGEEVFAAQASTLTTSTHRLSSSSTSSTPITHTFPSSSGVGGSAGETSSCEVFVNETNLSSTQSMMSLTRPYRISTGSDDDPRGFRKKSASALHALKNLSRSTPAMSPSASPRHSDSEGPPRVSKGTKKFMRHFSDAPSNEWVLNYFSCALVSDILLQGTLYITPNYFAFYSNIFGHVSRLLIPVSQVAGIQKERTAKIIPNAVGLQMLDGKTYAFGSLLSRDSTYKLMLHIWKKAQRMADSDSEPPSAVQVAGEDDGEDSVSGSAESLMEEDQTDSGYLASNPISTVAGVPTVSSSGPWTRDGPLTTTNTLSGILPSPDVCTSSTNTSSSIPLNSLANAPNCSVLQQGSSSTTRADALAEEPGGGGGTGTTAGAGGNGANYLEWFSEGSLVKTCFRMGSIPVKLVGEGVRELWSLPRTSLLLLISTLLLLMLFASAAFMLHRVDVLSQQLGLEKYDEYDSMYEEVLQMQQRLHAAASTEIEKTLSIQLKHIATVRQSLEALVVLFNKEPPMNTARIPDNT
ncbi:uncharacterized protein [Panulirus ornatus]|uniref:uncharacterized protein n=1 Tax=Panulirus ornatus TaxID=150431 RepID=UPI003A83719E